jgi:uncharacterized protein (TIGR00255 family)
MVKVKEKTERVQDMERNKLFSMTGYGRGEAEAGGIRVLAEIRSVNHRFLEIVVRLPHGWMALEDAVKKKVQQTVRRGRVDVFISVEGTVLPERKVQVDWPLLESLIQAGRELEEKWGIHGDLSLSDLMQKPELWVIDEPKWDAEAHRETLLMAVEAACRELLDMRAREGEVLARDLTGRMHTLLALVEKMEAEAPLVEKQVKERFRSRLSEWLAGSDVEPERLLMEVAIWVEKADITEELTRLKSHAHQFLETLTQCEPVGRRLDFLLQEMNREVNTIGSKTPLKSISSWVVDCKSELEKMKEQVQNIE